MNVTGGLLELRFRSGRMSIEVVFDDPSVPSVYIPTPEHTYGTITLNGQQCGNTRTLLAFVESHERISASVELFDLSHLAESADFREES